MPRYSLATLSANAQLVLLLALTLSPQDDVAGTAAAALASAAVLASAAAWASVVALASAASFSCCTWALSASWDACASWDALATWAAWDACAAPAAVAFWRSALDVPPQPDSRTVARTMGANSTIFFTLRL